MITTWNGKHSEFAPTFRTLQLAMVVLRTLIYSKTICGQLVSSAEVMCDSRRYHGRTVVELRDPWLFRSQVTQVRLIRLCFPPPCLEFSSALSLNVVFHRVHQEAVKGRGLTGSRDRSRAEPANAAHFVLFARHVSMMDR